jgi:hypothetical protein
MCISQNFEIENSLSGIGPPHPALAAPSFLIYLAKCQGSIAHVQCEM